jgi:hypothetical protein
MQEREKKQSKNKRRKRKEATTKISSEHRCDQLKNKEEETKEEVKQEEQDKEELYDECEGSYPDLEYPPPAVLKEQVPDDLPCQEDQETLPDEWYFPLCGKSPCLFLQWEEELDQIVDFMYPKVSNVVKRFHMYRHMTHKLHGPLRKGDVNPYIRVSSDLLTGGQTDPRPCHWPLRQ